MIITSDRIKSITARDRIGGTEFDLSESADEKLFAKSDGLVVLPANMDAPESGDAPLTRPLIRL